ncbi:MAG TPA: glucose-6-phosphate dehydrogenase [Acidimicrobiales bacterium]
MTETSDEQVPEPSAAMQSAAMQSAAVAATPGSSRLPQPAVLVIFGATGDLTARKLMPAVAALESKGELPAGFEVVGVGRDQISDDDFAERMRSAATSGDTSDWTEVAARARYVGGDYADPETFRRLYTVMAEIDEQRGSGGNRLYYLATPPSTFASVISLLGEHGLNKPGPGGSFARVVIEKPFGEDLESALELDRQVHAVFDEDQVYRIDHYLGKETVQNLLVLRFANAVFEPIWNRRYVDSVQITVAESLGIGHRAEFYEGAGALRDIVQNHLMQVLALTVMEPPVSMDPQGIRDEKVKALRAVDILTPEEVATDVVRARYERGVVEGEEVVGYREEDGVDRRSQTETFVAMRLWVDNWRWAGVPFYIRTGKRMPRRLTEVSLKFHNAPHLPFAPQQASGMGPNTLVLRIEPDEGISLCFGAKAPGEAFDLRTVALDFSYQQTFGSTPPDAYQRLLRDALAGDPTLFIRSDEVEQAWRIVAPIQEAWRNEDVKLGRYPAGTWGPKEADQLIQRDGRAWRLP